jgi:hypothetical protein
MKFVEVIVILTIALTVVWSAGDNQDEDDDQDHSIWPTHEFIVSGVSVSSIAHVRKHQNGTTFTLESYDQDHQCVPSTVQQLVFRFKKQLYQEVENNPLKSVNLIYQETRSEFPKMASKKQISNHPNPYVLAEVIKEELKAAKDNRCAAVIGNAIVYKYKNKKFII